AKSGTRVRRSSFLLDTSKTLHFWHRERGVQPQMTAQPTTRYARSGSVSIAYQVVGDGPRDIVHVAGWVSHLEAGWDEPRQARFRRRLASFSRLILFDKRGTGMSDRVADRDLPTLEQRMDAVRAVVAGAGS